MFIVFNHPKALLTGTALSLERSCGSSHPQALTDRSVYIGFRYYRVLLRITRRLLFQFRAPGSEFQLSGSRGGGGYGSGSEDPKHTCGFFDGLTEAVIVFGRFFCVAYFISPVLHRLIAYR